VGYTRGLEAFRTPLEHSLAAFAAHGARHDRLGAWQPTRIANLLETDLRDLGIEAMPSDAVVHIDDLAWALGAHYVLEGSALGARVLMPAARTLGFDAHHGARHLDKQASTLENFRAFMELLEGIEDLDMEQTAAGANAAFQSAARAMERSFAHA
ncbi:MAG: biliverdin-producing heme oxygenase, partial [Caulobacterales bacterium]